jgi:hypothetical protein
MMNFERDSNNAPVKGPSPALPGGRRDYTKQPLPIPQNPPVTRVPAQPRQLKKPRRKIWIIAVPIAVVLVLVAGGVTTYLLTRPQNPFSAETISEFKKPAFYPTYLPKGYVLHADAASVTGGALTFIASNGNDSRSLFFSEQVKQPSFNLKSYYQDQIPDQTGFSTSYGDAVIGHFLNVSPLQKQHLGAAAGATPTSTVGSLNTTDTWVLITAPKDFDLNELKKIVLSLKP